MNAAYPDEHLSAYLSTHMCTVPPHITCNHCLTNETDRDCISIFALISAVLNECCVFVHAERETPVLRREKSTSPI